MWKEGKDAPGDLCLGVRGNVGEKTGLLNRMENSRFRQNILTGLIILGPFYLGLLSFRLLADEVQDRSE